MKRLPLYPSPAPEQIPGTVVTPTLEVLRETRPPPRTLISWGIYSHASRRLLQAQLQALLSTLLLLG
jgi:hypothetical protein